ncbi:MAG: serine hydrolase domain-containing protein [Planctomycetota bacterium]
MLHPLLTLSLLSPLVAPVSEDVPESLETGLLPTWWIDTEPPEPQPIAARMAHFHTPAVSVAVLLDGKLAWARAWGVADVESGRAADENTLFQAASISKPVAALAALVLLEEGELWLDDDINTLLESWKVPDSEVTATEKVTVRRIVNHTAGLTVWGFPGYDPRGAWPTAAELLDGKGNTDPVRVFRTPGADWQYSGGGYTVLQVALEDVSGLDFTTLMAKRVLAPLGMTRSTYDQPLPEALRANSALGYTGRGEPVAGGAHVYPEQAAAGLWTTPAELAKYLAAVQRMAGGKAGLLQPETARLMLTPGKNGHGLGPILMEAADGRRFGHGGSNAGFKCDMFASLEGGYGAVVMTNGDDGFLLGQEVFHALARHYGWPGFDPEIKRVLEIDDAALAIYAGNYALEGMGQLTIAPGEGELRISTSWDDEVGRLLPDAEHTFFDADDRKPVVFEVADGRAVALTVGGRFRAERADD